MKDLPGIITWSIPGFVLLMILEIVSYRVHRDDDELGYVAKDTATSLTMGIGNVVSDALWKVPIVAAYSVVYALTPLRVTDGMLYTLPAALAAWPLLMVAQDLCYYWSHRAHHVVRILWASHVVHHSSQRLRPAAAAPVASTDTGGSVLSGQS